MNLVTQTRYLGAVPEVNEIGESEKAFTVLETTHQNEGKKVPTL